VVAPDEFLCWGSGRITGNPPPTHFSCRGSIADHSSTAIASGQRRLYTVAKLAIEERTITQPPSHGANGLRALLLAMIAASISASAIAQIHTASLQSNAAEASQTVASAPSIEVAVIKPHDPSSTYNDFRFSHDRVSLDNQSILRLIAFAYAINQKQIVDAPAWIREPHFDIHGKTNAETDPSLPQQQRMVRQLLADRFGLRFHRDKRELSVYALQIAKGGPKLTPASFLIMPSRRAMNK
jgi:hypothetical protein